MNDEIETVTPRDVIRREGNRSRLLLAVLLMLSAGCGGGRETPSDLVASCPECNVLLISLDTLRADHLGAYGYRRDTSPHMDGIAKQGILFRNTFTQAPWTLPSHFSIFTGLYPSRHQVVYNRSTVGPELQTLVELFYEHGYSTGAFTGGGFLRKRWGYEGFTTYSEVKIGADASWPEVRASAARALDWMNSVEEPFFVFWHTLAPHGPFVPEDRFDLWADPEYDGIVDTAPYSSTEVCGKEPERECVRKLALYYKILRDEGLLEEEDIRHVVAKYDGDIRSTDEVVGEIWRSLEESGKLERTIVVITSDHGETLVDEGRSGPLGHPNPSRGVVHVPWILWTPQGSPHELDRVVESIDILPTVAAILDVPIPWDIDGRNALGRDENEMSGIAVTEHWRVTERELASHSLVWRNWHLIRWNDGRGDSVQLYDMERDPTERNDLSSSEPERRARLERILDRWTRVIGSRLASSPAEQELDPGTIEELEALGYL